MKLLIVGASARAAAQSAHRAGFEVVASDLFADRDLSEIATCVPVSDYPTGFHAVRAHYADLPLVYTGAIENYPRLVEKLSSVGPLFGNGRATLERIRDPFQLARIFKSNGLPFPKRHSNRPPPPTIKLGC